MKKIFYFLIMLCLLLPMSSNTKAIFAVEEEAQPIKIDISVDSLQDYNCLTNYSKNYILTSSAKNQIVKIANNSTKKYENTGRLDGQISTPTFARQIEEDKIAIYDSACRVQIFDNNFKLLKIYRTTENFNLGVVVSASVDYKGNIFMLDKTNNAVLKIEQSKDYIQILNIKNLTIENESKIAVNANGSKVAILNNGAVTIYNLVENTQKFVNIDASDIVFDYLDNLFCIKSSSLITTIKKLDKLNFEFVTEKTFDGQYKSMSLDIETGTFYILSDNLYSYYPSNFAENASDGSLPIDIKTTNILASEVEFCTTKFDTKLFATCVSYSSSDNIEQNKLLMILKKDIEENNNMYFVLTNLNNVQKFGFVDKNNVDIKILQQSESTYKSICQNVDILTYPTSNAGVYSNIKDESTEVIVLNDTYNFVDFDGQSFYAVKLNDGIGYVNQRFLAKTGQFEATAQQKTPVVSNTSQFVAFVMIIFGLLLVTIFIIIFVCKKHKNSKI